MAGSCEERLACTKPPGLQRPRWNANQHQLQHLERMFEEGNGSTPNKQRIKDIALDLGQYGSISDTNVYNWFQNRKARAKRKLQQRLHCRTSARSRLSHRKTPSTTAHHAAAAALKLRVDEAVKAGEEVGETSPRAKRFKSQELDGPHNDVELSESCLNVAPNSELEAGSSSVGGIECEFEEELRSHVDFATLATNPTQLIANHGDVTCNGSMIFNEDHFHEQVQGKAWDDLVRSFSCGESSQVIRENSHTQNLHLLSAHEDHLYRNRRFGVAGDKLISLAGGPVPSMDEPRKGYALPETT